MKAKQLEAVLSIIWIQLLSNAEECVDYDVLHSLHEMLFNIDIMLFKLLIQVLLKVVIAQSISFFMGSIRVQLVLETLISKMHSCAFRIGFILTWRGSQVPVFVDVYFEILCYKSPDSNIEFPLFVK